MPYNAAEIQKQFDRIGDAVEAEVRRRARAVLRRCPELNEFVKAMGLWVFTDHEGDSLLDFDGDPRFAAVAEIICEWDHSLHLTGTPVRFTARGPVVTDWW
jgi:hypothetical protein